MRHGHGTDHTRRPGGAPDVGGRAVRHVRAPDGPEIAVHRLTPEDPGEEVGGRPDLLLAHATGFCGPVLAPLADHLAPAFTCWALDERGHGRSDTPVDEDFDWHGFATDVLAVVDGLGWTAPLGFGHSCGGSALLLAEQARPGTFAALYCYEPIVLPIDTPGRPVLDNPMSRAAGRRRERFASREEARAHFAAKPPLDALDPAVLAAYVTHGFRTTDDGGVTLACRPRHEALIYANGLAHDAWAHLGEVGCPVTVAHGADSEVMGPDQAQALAARLPRGRARTLPGLDHFGPLQDPAQVARAVLDDLAPTWSP